MIKNSSDPYYLILLFRPPLIYSVKIVATPESEALIMFVSEHEQNAVQRMQELDEWLIEPVTMTRSELLDKGGVARREGKKLGLKLGLISGLLAGFVLGVISAPTVTALFLG